MLSVSLWWRPSLWRRSIGRRRIQEADSETVDAPLGKLKLELECRVREGAQSAARLRVPMPAVAPSAFCMPVHHGRPATSGVGTVWHLAGDWSDHYAAYATGTVTQKTDERPMASRLCEGPPRRLIAPIAISAQKAPAPGGAQPPGKGIIKAS